MERRPARSRCRKWSRHRRKAKRRSRIRAFPGELVTAWRILAFQAEHGFASVRAIRLLPVVQVKAGRGGLPGMGTVGCRGGAPTCPPPPPPEGRENDPWAN